MSGLVIKIDDSILVVRGFKAGQRLRESGLKAVYGTTVGGWMLDRRRLSDLLAYLDSRNIAARVVDPEHEGPGDAA